LLGLVLFLGVHSFQAVANGLRTRLIGRIGLVTYKVIFSIVFVLGLTLIVWGFAIARETPVMVWLPSMAMRYVAGAFLLLAFVFFASAYVPSNAIKSRFHHPLLLGVKTWALAHLLANGSVASILLFSSFFLWSTFLFIVSRRRDRALKIHYPAGTLTDTAVAVCMGITAWALVAFVFHGMLIGIRPLG
jgi:uncharacterized membrane protein